MASVLAMWQSMNRRPLGAWFFSKAVCWKAPYFGSISPRFVLLEPGRCEAIIHDRRRVRNHIGTVHVARERGCPERRRRESLCRANQHVAEPVAEALGAGGGARGWAGFDTAQLRVEIDR